MDNDNKLKKALVRVYRNGKLKLDYMGMNLTSEEGGNALIASMIKDNKPFVVGRFGAVEMRLVSRYSNAGGGTRFLKEKTLCTQPVYFRMMSSFLTDFVKPILRQ